MVSVAHFLVSIKPILLVFSLVHSLLPNDLKIQNLFIFTAAVVLCGGRESLPDHHYSADYIFWSFEIVGFISSRPHRSICKHCVFKLHFSYLKIAFIFEIPNDNYVFPTDSEVGNCATPLVAKIN